MARDAHAPAYNGLGQFRSDAWSELEESASQLALAAAAQRPVAGLETSVGELLGRLEPAERFWAFPGPGAFQLVQRLFAAAKYDRLAAIVSRINRALVTELSAAGGRSTWRPRTRRMTLMPGRAISHGHSGRISRS